ncbi:MAG TPA: hypothetical protein VMX74_01800 [Pirellulales bacterium]|nr:hypothetical protein [Pirellulales bacterium]
MARIVASAKNMNKRAWDIRMARLKYGTSTDRNLSAFTASEIAAFKAANRKVKDRAESEQVKKAKARQDRLIQLAKMPGGRGAKEFNRLVEGGSTKESAAEKAARQRQAQLKEMPNGRGKVDAEKVMAEGKRQEALDEARRKGMRPTTMTQPGQAGKKSPGTADGSSRPASTADAGATKAKAKREMVKNPYAAENKVAGDTAAAVKAQAAKQQAEAKAAAEAAKKKAAAEAAKKKAAMAAKMQAFGGKK